MLGKSYLRGTMPRRILTCLALITGLAAVGAPLNATVVGSLSEQVGASKPASTSPASEECECRSQRGSDPSKREPNAKCKPRKPVIIYIPTVQFGADRAYE